MSLKQVIAIRTDLNMRKGKMAAQAAHASRAFLKDHLIHGWPLHHEMREWLAGSHDTICVGVPSEDELTSLSVKAGLCGVPVRVVTDLGKTEFHGQETKACAAFGPAESSRVDAITGHLKLL